MYCVHFKSAMSLRWRHNGRDSVSNYQPHHCLLNRSFRRRSKKTSNLRVTGLCVGNSPLTGEFPAQMASNAENVSIWWRHHVYGSALHQRNAISWICRGYSTLWNLLSLRFRTGWLKHTWVGTKWPIFCRRPFQMQFLGWWYPYVV